MSRCSLACSLLICVVMRLSIIKKCHLQCLVLLVVSFASCLVGNYFIKGGASFFIKPSRILTGTASWYGHPFHGRRTANGEIYDMHQLTAAHKSLPFNSILRITNLENNKKVTVRINDRGPYVGARIIDLSYRAAQKLGMADRGITKIRAEVFLPERSKDKRVAHIHVPGVLHF